MLDTGIDTAPEAAIASMILVYMIAALFNLYIPRTEAPLQPMARGALALVRDFASCNARLWDDKLGQISLATTTLFWGVGGNLRYIVLAWAAAALGYTHHAGVVAGRRGGDRHRGRRGASPRCACGWTAPPRVIPLGIAMGLLVIGMNVIDNVWVGGAVPDRCSARSAASWSCR